jgi:hypothetical protein
VTVTVRGRRFARARTWLPLFGLSLAACSAGFNTPEKLEATRILAIAADPPQPPSGTATILRPLVYVPAGEDASFSWSWCPLPTGPDDNYACHLDQAGADALFATLGITQAPPLDLGTGDTASFTNPLAATAVAALCSSGVSISPVPFACTATGLPITIRLVVHAAQGDLPAVTNVFVPADDSLPPNHNPVISGLTIGDPPQPLDSSAPIALPLASHIPLHALIDEASAEPLPRPGPDDKPYERLSLSWFVELGDFGYQGKGGVRTGFLGDPNDPESPFAAALDNTWNTPSNFSAAPIRIVVVVRDNRGGVAWTDGLVHLEPTP